MQALRVENRVVDARRKGKDEVMSTVRNAILDHLKTGGTITKVSALFKPYSTTNLGDKIFLLRKAGHDIQKRWKETPEGKRYAEYFIPQKIQGY